MNEFELLEKYGSPLYVYDESVLIKRINDLLEFAKDLGNKINAKVSMHYSSKANANLHLLKIIKENGMFVDSMSPIELALTQKAGFTSNEIVYVCNNVSQEEMKYVVDQNVLICLDSVSQVEKYGQISPNTSIMVRINPEEGGVGHCEKVVTVGKEARFGIVEKDFEALFEVVKKYNLKIIGVHQHFGSSFFDDDIDGLMNGINIGLNLINKYFPEINIIDFGGGFGVPYNGEEPLSFDILSEKLSKVLKPFIEKSKVNEIKFEPGRYVVCESGTILGTVNSIKESFSTKWIGTDVGMNVLLRPSMYDAYHKIEIINKENNNGEYIKATIVGNVCESGDILGKDRNVKKAFVGDAVKVYNTGAYGFSMSSSYTGRPTVAEILKEKNGEYRVIRKREKIDDIINRF